MSDLLSPLKEVYMVCMLFDIPRRASSRRNAEPSTGTKVIGCLKFFCNGPVSIPIPLQSESSVAVPQATGFGTVASTTTEVGDSDPGICLEVGTGLVEVSKTPS